jgi:hypothetical protein
VPALQQPEKWSDNFKEFLGLCLKMKADARPTIKELLKVRKNLGASVISQIRQVPLQIWTCPPKCLTYFLGTNVAQLVERGSVAP